MEKLTQAFSQLSVREQRTMVLGTIAAVFIVGYFFVIEPLDKKTQQQQQVTATRTKQLSEMQAMAVKLLSQRKQNAQTAAQILGNRIAGETLEGEQRVIKTRPLATAEAKQLLYQLIPLGKVALYPSQQSAEVWFWAN